MNCATLSRILDLIDADTRPDPAAMTDHLRGCSACAARYPEVLEILDTATPRAVSPTRVPRVARTAVAGASLAPTALARTFVGLAAAALLVASGTLYWQATPFPQRDVSTPVVARTLPELGPGSIRFLPSHVSRVTHTTRRVADARAPRTIENVVVRATPRVSERLH